MNNKSGSDRLKAWVHWKLLEKDLDDDDKQFALDIQDLQKLCEEQKGEIQRLKDLSSKAYAHGKSDGMIEIDVKLQSRLATQTERVRTLTEVVDKAWHHAFTITQSAVPIEAKVALAQEIKDFTRQALQDTLGDGGNKE